MRYLLFRLVRRVVFPKYRVIPDGCIGFYTKVLGCLGGATTEKAHELPSLQGSFWITKK
jgi:hypothetical protein